MYARSSLYETLILLLRTGSSKKKNLESKDILNTLQSSSNTKLVATSDLRLL